MFTADHAVKWETVDGDYETAIFADKVAIIIRADKFWIKPSNWIRPNIICYPYNKLPSKILHVMIYNLLYLLCNGSWVIYG